MCTKNSLYVVPPNCLILYIDYYITAYILMYNLVCWVAKSVPANTGSSAVHIPYLNFVSYIIYILYSTSTHEHLRQNLPDLYSIVYSLPDYGLAEAEKCRKNIINDKSLCITDCVICWLKCYICAVCSTVYNISVPICNNPSFFILFNNLNM